MKKLTMTVLAVSLILLSMTLVSCFHTHEWSEWQTITDATCTENGSKQRTCECGEVETEAIEATGHTPSAETCKNSQTCLTCNEVLAAALAHKDPQWITVVEPTCTKMGSRKQVCSYCSTIMATEAIKSTGHTEGEPATCTTAQICLTCNETLVQALGHKESEWIIDAEPTCTEDGSKHKTCSVCENIVKTETIEMLDHNYLLDSMENNGAVGSNIIYMCENCHDSYYEVVEELSISVQFDGMSSATMGGYGSFTKYYVVTVTGGYGSYKYRYEVFKSSSSTTPMSHLTKDWCNDTEYGISYRGYENQISGYVLQVTVMDEAGNTATYRYTI